MRKGVHGTGKVSLAISWTNDAQGFGAASLLRVALGTHRTKPRGCQTWSSHERHERRTCRRKEVAWVHPCPGRVQGGRGQAWSVYNRVDCCNGGTALSTSQADLVRAAACSQYQTRYSMWSRVYATSIMTTHLLGALLGDSGRRFLLGSHCSLRCGKIATRRE